MCLARPPKRCDEKDAPIDPEARRAHGLWKGTPIKLETDFIIRRKLKPTLEAVGAGLDTVVKAQVYLRDQEDIPGFREVWAKHFPVAARDDDHRDRDARVHHAGVAHRD